MRDRMHCISSATGVIPHPSRPICSSFLCTASVPFRWYTPPKNACAYHNRAVGQYFTSFSSPNCGYRNVGLHRDVRCLLLGNGFSFFGPFFRIGVETQSGQRVRCVGCMIRDRAWLDTCQMSNDMHPTSQRQYSLVDRVHCCRIIVDSTLILIWHIRVERFVQGRVCRMQSSDFLRSA